MNSERPRVLIPLATPCFYGLEHAIIETFDALRPAVTPQIVQSACVARRRPPIVEELERRRMPFTLLPDGTGWPTLGRPRSMRELLRMLVAVAVGNWYYARAVAHSDALYVTGSRLAMFTLAAGVRCRLTGKRVLHHFHELPDRPLPRMWRWMVTDCIHNSVSGRDAAMSVDSGIRRKHHAVLAPVVDVADTGTAEIAVDESHQNIVFAGQVALHKGIDLLLDGFARLAPKHPRAVLHILGGCQESFLAAFNGMCDRTGVGERIRYWGYRTDVPAFFRNAVVCVQATPPSRCAESFGRTAVEAMAFGVPVVCFGSGALKEIVRDGETGLVCEETAEALTAGIERLLCDTNFRERCGTNARRRYAEHFSVEVVRPPWLQFLCTGTHVA